MPAQCTVRLLPDTVIFWAVPVAETTVIAMLAVAVPPKPSRTEKVKVSLLLLLAPVLGR